MSESDAWRLSTMEAMTRTIATLELENFRLRRDMEVLRDQLRNSEKRREESIYRAQKTYEQSSQSGAMVSIIGGWRRQIQQAADSVSSRSVHARQYRDECKNVVKLAGQLEALLKEVT